MKWNDVAIESAVESALTHVLHDYDDLIANPAQHAPKWWEYGSRCRLCWAVVLDCSLCPLRNPKKDEPVPCATATRNTLTTCLRTMQRFQGEVERGKYPRKLVAPLKKAARARYQWILQRMDKNGWEYK